MADGCSDWALPELSFHTPLEVAEHPHLDRVAREGVCGLLDPIAPGVPAGSDTSHLALFGYDPFEDYCNRGPYEALGVGIDLKPGDIAFRVNLGTVDENGVLIDRRAGRIDTTSARRLLTDVVAAVQEQAPIEFVLRHATEHRAALVLRGEGLSPLVADTDPHRVGVPVPPPRPLSDDPAAKRTADALQQLLSLIHHQLRNHPINKQRKAEGKLPANTLLLRGAGLFRPLPSFYDKWGLRACCVGATALILGVARAAGMDVITPPGATGSADTDLLAKARAVVNALQNHDFVYLHFKATDSASHDHKPWLKIELLRRFDQAIGYILDHTDPNNTIVVVTADHTTSSVLGEHTGDPTPLAVLHSYVVKDDVRRFTERECAKGALGRFAARYLMNHITNWMGIAHKVGA